MHMNKFATIGLSLLLIFGCILAAGCVGNEQADPMVDYWICSDADIGNGVIVDMYAKFNADGTGTCVLYRNGELYQNETVVWENLGNGMYQFAITAEGLGTYTVQYAISSDLSSMSDESGRTWYKLPAFLPLDTADSMIGTWGVSSVKNGNTVENIFIFHNDGSGYWLRVNETPALSFSRLRLQTWGKTDENSYVGICAAGRIYDMKYQPETDSFILDGSAEFTRLDPAAGIWTGTSEKAVVTTFLKSNGTGIETEAYSDGTACVSSLTWEKKDNGTYAFSISDETAETWTIGAENLSMHSDTGLSRTKQLMDSYYLLPVIGAWYDAENNVSAVLNGDATGTVLHDSKVTPVTWEYTWEEIDVIDIMVSLPEKTSEWSYNSTSDSLATSQGLNFTRPSETVDGMITIR
ncbi:MAG TPA: hypothetical protein O0Y12_02765 [Methanocorpusculum sp.]|nr:hypothetical protein [Methanocorpusculum sp.]